MENWCKLTNTWQLMSSPLPRFSDYFTSAISVGVWKERELSMGRRDQLSISERRIKKAEKKVKKMKAWTAQEKEEVGRQINLAETRYQAILQIREAVHPLFLAAQSLNAQLDHLISACFA
ncbi:hypothetical protein V6N13_133365 [Hibiscus sabdariffa]|uniref:Remorin C-terminal domain-containing protein n=1 Tax=Hibiscus sabdariffa TaxID=183260 RepID=A0ABR2CIM8_9ROSI